MPLPARQVIDNTSPERRPGPAPSCPRPPGRRLDRHGAPDCWPPRVTTSQRRAHVPKSATRPQGGSSGPSRLAAHRPPLDAHRAPCGRSFRAFELFPLSEQIYELVSLGSFERRIDLQVSNEIRELRKRDGIEIGVFYVELDRRRRKHDDAVDVVFELGIL